jgi:hypothetical protein
MQDAKDVAAAYDLFRAFYRRFRKRARLAAARGNAYEVTTALADKVGRICRLVKHSKRHDPIPQMQQQMEETVAGIVVYLEMLVKLYTLDMKAGFRRELMKAVLQHVKKT